MKNTIGIHTPNFYFLIGQSGCGKDTVMKNIIDSYDKELLVFATGNGVRGMIALGTEQPELLFPRRMNEINSQSQRQPADLALHFIIDFLSKNYTGNEDIVINGSPRSEEEALGLARLIRAGYLPKAKILWINVPDEIAFERLVKANRSDRNDSNTEEAIRRKMSWYNDVLGAREFIVKECSDVFEIIDIDGTPDPETVWQSMKPFLPHTTKTLEPKLL